MEGTMAKYRSEQNRDATRRWRRMLRSALPGTGLETVEDLLLAYPYRTVIGKLPGPVPDADEMTSRIGEIIVIMGDHPEPLSEQAMADAVAIMRSGRTVMLMSRRADLRDYMKREIWAMVGPVAGSA
jgi:hypothetical protein